MAIGFLRYDQRVNSMIWMFDIDGTLVRCGGAGSMAMTAALSSEFKIEASTKGVAFSGRTDYAITKDLFALHDIPFEASTVSAFYRAYLLRLPDALSHCNGLVLPGVLNWLEKIADAGCSIGILTGNMESAARIKLNHFSLSDHFGFGAYGDSLLNRNEVAESAVEQAERFWQKREARPVPARESMWIVGDTPHDVNCAKSQGLNSIGVATGSYSASHLSEHHPNFSLSTLADDTIIDRLLLEYRQQ